MGVCSTCTTKFGLHLLLQATVVTQYDIEAAHYFSDVKTHFIGMHIHLQLDVEATQGAGL
jgi:hypothetical protein